MVVPKSVPIKDRLIIALDVDSLDQATPLVEALSPYAGCFKVGLELLTAAGAPQVVEHIHHLGGAIFFDGKFDDIPNTVGKASRAVSRLGVKCSTSRIGRRAIHPCSCREQGSLPPSGRDGPDIDRLVRESAPLRRGLR